MKRTFCAGLALGLSLFTNTTHAYEFTSDFNQGFYWQSFPISMGKFSPTSTDATTLDMLSNAALTEWEDAIGRNIWSFSGPVIIGSPATTNYIRWSYNFAAETGWDPVYTLAVTTRYSNGTYINQTTIILNGEKQNLRENWNDDLYKTILHEMGHTIGLDHSSEEAIMQGQLGYISSLTSDDVAGGNEAVDQQLFKQSIGFVSKFGVSEEKSGGACGTVDMSSGGSGPGPFSMSFIFGILIALTVNLGEKLKFGKVRQAKFSHI